jgi:hypothetical protein
LAGVSLALLSLISANALASAWQKTTLATTQNVLAPTGFPITDEFGDPVPALPKNYAPNVHGNASSLHFLRVSHSQLADPPILGDAGFPVLGNYYQLSTASILSDAWSTTAPFTDFNEEVAAPSFVRRLDDTVSIAHWLGDLLHIDTMASPSNTRLTLPIAKEVGTVAIDSNEGVHVLVISSDYELWHFYYLEGALAQSKLSDGPVCEVVVEAGESDVCHVAYSTFTEDVNLNEALDDGEDINGNGVLDETPMHLIYQSVEANTPSAMELIDDDTVLKFCNFDLHFSSAHGLKLAYADSSRNEIRLAERSSSSWSSVKVSSAVSMFNSVALAVTSTGKCAITYVSSDQRRLYVVEEEAGQWSETLISQVATGKYFTGTDVAFNADDQLAVLTSEKDRIYLNLYSRSAVADLLSTLVRPTEIRGAFIITWPTPSEGATKQVLQVSSNLADPDSWEFVAQRTYWRNPAEVMETVAEKDGPNRFYRVIELSD